jgi:DNA-binding NarL/FixJ family response regulator
MTPEPALQPRHLLIVEDNPVFRRQLERVLERLGLRANILSCATGTQALDLLELPRTQVDLAFLDLGLPDISGLEVIHAMRRRFPEAPVLVISVIDSERTLLAAIRAGARGYVLKGQSEENLMATIEDVMRGNYPIGPSLARVLFKLAGAPMAAAAQEFGLSPRELETLRLISRGHSYDEVASLMGVALSTVQSNIRNLYRKLDAHSQVQAVSKAREAGLL